jgi:ribosomal protein S18 acetylase RimI-like enzyme
MNRIEGFTFARRDASWVEENLARISAMHTDAMARSWNEEWSNDPNGTDTRRFSPALIRDYIDSGSAFFSASTKNGEIAGYGIVLPLSHAYLAKHGRNGEWANHREWLHPQTGKTFDASDLAPLPGDMEMALVITDPAHTGRGVFRRLAEMRLNYSFASLNDGQRIWLQTLENSDITTVSRFYKEHGFEVLARVRVKSTVRVILSQVIDIKDDRGEQTARFGQYQQQNAT